MTEFTESLCVSWYRKMPRKTTARMPRDHRMILNLLELIGIDFKVKIGVYATFTSKPVLYCGQAAVTCCG